ncbi:unnamed protein product [Discula destructiva]
MDVSDAGHPPASGTSSPADLPQSSPRNLHRAVFARRADYTRPHRIRIKVGTWNVAACPGTDKDLASWFIDGKGIDTRLESLDLSHNPAVDTQTSEDSAYVDPTATHLLGGDKIGLYVLGLQEVVNLNPVTQYVYSETNPTDKWRLALEAALPPGYQFVASAHLSGLLLLLYASPEVAPRVGNISTKVVGTGVGGWFGNKGAAVARIVLGETTKLVLVNSHLSSGSDIPALERRCWDAGAILDRVRFDPISHPGHDQAALGDKIGDEDFVFWFGDLNFRMDTIPADDIRRLLTLHTRGEYDLNNPRPDTLDGEEGIIVTRVSDSSDDQTDDASARTRSTDQSSDDDSVSLPDPDDFEDPHGDPASLQSTLDSLLPHDQLRRLMKQGKLFHGGWREGPITFLPTYKYDVGTIGLFDSSEKKRAPSWCDRIIFRTRAEKENHERQVKENEEARKKDMEMKARGIDHAADDEVLFDCDPDSDGEATPDGEPGLDYDEYDDAGDTTGGPSGTEDGVQDRLSLDIYTSHQRITSSDHKPVVAIFTLDFDAVVPELKADVLAEVARELDRAENEGRPSITIASESTQSPENSVDFGEVRYLEQREAHLTLANTGRVPATFNFVDKPWDQGESDGGSGFSQWLSVSMTRNDVNDSDSESRDLGKTVTLEPGETVNAAIRALIDKPSQARTLNEGRASLENVLVLRVTGGRDHFLSIRAAWLPTCIGRSIDELIRVPDGGIRAFVLSSPFEKQGKHLGPIPMDAGIHRSAPKELFKLIEALEVLTDRTIADEQMLGSYTIPKDKHGWPFEGFIADPHNDLLPAVIDMLDTDRPVADAFPPETGPCERLETVAEVLLLFLESLTDGIISESLWPKIEQAPIRALGQAPPPPPSANDIDIAEEDRTAILDVLAGCPNHNICFVFLAATLAKMLGELAPVTKSATEELSKTAAMKPSGAIGAIARKSLSLRRSVTGGGIAVAQLASMADAVEAVQKRKAGERRLAQVFGKVVGRVPAKAGMKERRGLEGKLATLVELFLRDREDGR